MSAAGDHRETANLSILQRNVLIVGAVALIVCTLYGVLRPTAFFRAYLMAFEFWLGVSLGSMAIMMIRHLTGGAWGLYLRPVLEAAAFLVPLLGVLFLPLLVLGLPYVYPWHPRYLPASQWNDLADSKHIWFDLPFFIGRSIAYFVLWTVLAFLLNSGTREPATAAQEPPRSFAIIGAIGLVVYGLTITLASIDWSMSLDPKWFSSMYPPMYASGQLLAGFAFTVLSAVLLVRATPVQLCRDFGNLLMTFTLIWAYLAFSQFLLVWAGNLPEETVYFVPRMENGWQWVALLLVVGQFALPFLLLLSMRIKINPRLLAIVASISLAMQFVNLVWLTVPSFRDASWDLVVLAPALLIGLGGVWLSLFLWRLQRRPIFTVAEMHLEVPTYE